MFWVFVVAEFWVGGWSKVPKDPFLTMEFVVLLNRIMSY